jgi:hypothetical protein
MAVGRWVWANMGIDPGIAISGKVKQDKVTKVSLSLRLFRGAVQFS